LLHATAAALHVASPRALAAQRARELPCSPWLPLCCAGHPEPALPHVRQGEREHPRHQARVLARRRR
jgi:hypothetical protein